MKRFGRLIPVLFAALVVPVAVRSFQAPPKSDVINATELLADLKALSADDMQGRQIGTPGGEKARAFVVRRFKAAGITPFGAAYTHPFTAPAGRGAAERQGVNVAGFIEGSRQPKRFIVITAHYDHLGVRNGQVFNGADDNASGTAALFAVARYFAKNRPASSLLFAALDGEESGLLGARAFVQKPPVDLSALAINLNMDMIGRDPNNLLFVVGTRQQPLLKPFIERVAARAPVKLVMGHDDPAGKDDWTSDSDHFAFCQAKIPCLYFGVEDFDQHHRATDDYETMTFPFYVRAVETMILAVREFDAGLDEIAPGRAKSGAASPPEAAPQATPPSAPDASQPVEFAVPGGKVAGSLLMPPAASGKVPVVLIVAGSGPTDRDGNSRVLPGKNNSYRQLAEALALSGIASLRYDKRGLGASAVAGRREEDARFETSVSDAASWVTFLRNDARFSTITVAGHSEGSLIGMLAARAARADAFASIAGIARNAADVLRDQLRPKLAQTPDLWTASEEALTALVAGKTTSAPPAALATLYRPSVQPYLISWFRYVPSAEIARLTIPVLILQGTTDIQVPVSEADRLKAAKADATLRIVPGMNHVLKLVSESGNRIGSYSDPGLPIATDVPAAITDLVRGLEAPGVTRPRRPTGQRVSLRDTVLANVGPAHVAIEYGRPSKRGRVIWGTLVPFGKWWMPGADEASTFTTSETLVFGNLVVPAGEYTLYSLPNDASFALIVNRETGQYHTTYNTGRDLGRIEMTMTKTAQTVERVTYAFEPRADGGVLKLSWDDREYSAPFVVKR